MGFYDRMEEEVTKTFTENGAPTFSSSLNKNLDFFATSGASRNRDTEAVKLMFADAFRENEETALRNLVYLRDVRGGGLGERKSFRSALDFLIELGTKDNMLIKLVRYLPGLSRWDDIVYVFNKTTHKPLKQSISNLLAHQLLMDVDNMNKGESVSLAAKWMPSANTSNREVRKTAKELIKYMYGSYSPQNEKKYRKTLVALRDYLNVVEVRMTEKNYDKIDYSQVPSGAALRYRKAFMRNDEEGYSEYLSKLSTGEAKINASVTYPYEIVHKYMGEYQVDTLLEEAWESLPDYIGDNDERAIVVADTSGSMYGQPMEVSVSLAIYCAQRLKGEFQGRYISFSGNPTLNYVAYNSTLKENINKVYRTDWGMNTDINKVFQLILDTAVKNNMSQDEVPNKVIIVSDMQFDRCTGGGYGWGNHDATEWNETNYQAAKRKFAQHGYNLPQIVFWNVNAHSSIVPVRRDEVGTALVSGLTPSIFANVLSGSVLNPEQMMLDVLYQDKYDFVKELFV